MLHNGCNVGTRGLSDMYTLIPAALDLLVCIYIPPVLMIRSTITYYIFIAQIKGIHSYISHIPLSTSTI